MERLAAPCPERGSHRADLRGGNWPGAGRSGPHTVDAEFMRIPIAMEWLYREFPAGSPGQLYMRDELIKMSINKVQELKDGILNKLISD